METIKKENNRILNSDLNIWWWNFRKKTIDFEGTAKEYLKRENISVKVKYYKDVDYDFENNIINVSFSVGNLNPIKFTCREMEDAIRMSINIRLSYLGDKSTFRFLGRTRTINF